MLKTLLVLVLSFLTPSYFLILIPNFVNDKSNLELLDFLNLFNLLNNSVEE